MSCNCNDWKENFNKVIAPLMNEVARNPQNYEIDKNGIIMGYTGKKFIYCPWCGEKNNAAP